MPGTETAPDKNGVYEVGKKKKTASSFFPQHWDRVDVLKAVKEASENKRHKV
ncbi:EndoU domain-containing protein [Cerasibacillus terrae]|uniref:EndoU domain-containing protein n=1 Tax=Cerasibacillus terrae TaxID=2498845 RepID=UPI001E5C3FA8|nr:EndoU domain-containing protein [Cerasibacillus terrae]